MLHLTYTENGTLTPVYTKWSDPILGYLASWTEKFKNWLVLWTAVKAEEIACWRKNTLPGPKAPCVWKESTMCAVVTHEAKKVRQGSHHEGFADHLEEPEVYSISEKGSLRGFIWEMTHQVWILERHLVTNLENRVKKKETTSRKITQKVTADQAKKWS